MKNFITVFFFAFTFSCFSQTTKTYKADQWYDIKGKGGFVNAMNNPTREKVEISKDDKQIKVLFGAKTFIYKITSSNKFSEVKTDYTVKLKEKTYTLSISKMPDGTIAVGIDGQWMVSDIME